ncbi:MAG TPA: hypothetical protein VK364_12565, partial [Hymenobacter sp.]|nr:hypothetical protein [Hymenobacter sp.]
MKRIAYILTGCALALTGCNSFRAEKKLFQSLDSAQTGVGFTNKLVPNEKLNFLDYLYFYNGGGVS